MDNFIKKSDNDIIEDRTNILKDKIYKNNNNNLSLSNTENINSYVRVQYLLGEPCWGKYSIISNFSLRILYKINNPIL